MARHRRRAGRPSSGRPGSSAPPGSDEALVEGRTARRRSRWSGVRGRLLERSTVGPACGRSPSVRASSGAAEPSRPSLRLPDQVSDLAGALARRIRSGSVRDPRARRASSAARAARPTRALASEAGDRYSSSDRTPSSGSRPPTGPRFINPYLAPIEERLRGTAARSDRGRAVGSPTTTDTWRRPAEQGAERTLPVDVAPAAWACRRTPRRHPRRCGHGGHLDRPARSDTRRRVRRRPGSGAGCAASSPRLAPARQSSDLDLADPRADPRLRAGRSPPRRRVPPPGLDRPRPGRGRPDRGHPARDDLPLAQRLHPPRSAADTCGSPIGRTSSASGNAGVLIVRQRLSRRRGPSSAARRGSTSAGPAGRRAMPSAPSSGSRRATGSSCCPGRGGRSYRRFHYPDRAGPADRPAAARTSTSS